MFDFDEIIDRRGTHCSKWDLMQPLYGVSPDDGLAMWVADMDFRSPPEVTAALEAEAAHGVFGYFGDDRALQGGGRGWMPAATAGRSTPPTSSPPTASSPASPSACRPSPSPATG